MACTGFYIALTWWTVGGLSGFIPKLHHCRLGMRPGSELKVCSFHFSVQSYSDFHDDLFPNTAGGEPAMTAQQWFEGANEKVSALSQLDLLGPPSLYLCAEIMERVRGSK